MEKKLDQLYKNKIWILVYRNEIEIGQRALGDK